MNNEYAAKVQQCANQGQKLMQALACQGIFESLYLYARQSVPGIPGELALVRDSEEAPAGYKLVTGEGLRCNVPYANFHQWVWERARRAPIMSID